MSDRTKLGKHELLIGGFGPPKGDSTGISLIEHNIDAAIMERYAQMATPSPSALTMSSTGRTVFAVEENEAGVVHSFRLLVSGNGHRLSRVNSQSSGGGNPCHLAVHPDGKWLFVSNYTGATVGVLPIGYNGRLGEIAEVRRFSGSGLNQSRQTGSHPHMVTVLPRGNAIVVADLGADKLYCIPFDSATGRLGPHHESIVLPAGSGPRQVVLGPRGIAYVLGELDGTLSVIDLRERRVISVLAPPEDCPGVTLAGTLLRLPNGLRLLATYRSLNLVAEIDICNPLAPRYRRVLSRGGSVPRHLCEIGGWIYIAWQASGIVTAQRAEGDIAASIKIDTPTYVMPTTLGAS